jgi:hypothetical protein
MSFDTVEVAGSSPVVPTISFQRFGAVAHPSNPGVLSVLQSTLLHSPVGMAEDRVQDHLLGRDQFIHIRLGVMIEHGGAPRVPHAALRRLDVGLLLGDEERCQTAAQIVEPEPLALLQLHPPP